MNYSFDDSMKTLSTAKESKKINWNIEILQNKWQKENK